MKTVFLLFFLLLNGFSFAAKLPMNLLIHADSIDKSLTVHHQDLSAYLIEAAHSDREKVLIFAYWIAANIRYDLNELKRLTAIKSHEKCWTINGQSAAVIPTSLNNCVKMLPF